MAVIAWRIVKKKYIGTAFTGEGAARGGGWDLVPPTTSSQFFGDQWLSKGDHAVLSISSKIIPGESNYLINPNHQDFSKMIIGKPLDYPYDSRLE